MFFRNLIILSQVFLNVLLFAQQPNAVKGKDIIQKTVAKNKSYKSSKVDFKYIIESKMDTSREVFYGTIYLKDVKFKLIMGDQIIISDNKTIWIYLKDANEVQVNTYNPAELELNPNEIFTMWEKGYLYGYVGDYTINAKSTELVELTPTDKSKDYYKVKLYVDKTSRHIVRMQTYYKNSSIMTFDVKSIVPNINLLDNFFRFDASKYPGVQVIDLR